MSLHSSRDPKTAVVFITAIKSKLGQLYCGFMFSMARFSSGNLSVLKPVACPSSVLPDNYFKYVMYNIIKGLK